MVSSSTDCLSPMSALRGLSLGAAWTVHKRVKLSKDECRHTQREDEIPHLADIDLLKVDGELVTVRLSSDVNLIYI